jgi:hypothetical protein
LPHDKILTLFREGIQDVGHGRQTYQSIIVGLAPEGEVSVFLSGIGATVEVINNLRAREVETEWKEITDNDDISRAEYIKIILKEAQSNEQVEHLLKHGIPKGLMDSYRQQYPWKPKMANGKPEYMVIKTLNGELEYYNFLKPHKPRSTRGIPKQINYRFWDLKGEQYYTQIFFNEERTIEDFERFFSDLSNDETNLEFVFIEKPRTLNRSKVLRTMDIYLKNADSQVKLATDSIKLH